MARTLKSAVTKLILGQFTVIYFVKLDTSDLNCGSHPIYLLSASLKVTGYRWPYMLSVHNDIDFVVLQNSIMTARVNGSMAAALCK